MDASREAIGKLIGAKNFREIIFTSGATEANNLALRGAVEFYKAARKAGIKPILGVETYVAPRDRFSKEPSLTNWEKSF